MADMDRIQAAARLGIGLDATSAEVKAAFRRQVWSSHPDAGATSPDLDSLTAARDVLLAALLVLAEPTRPPTKTAAPIRLRPDPPTGRGFALVWKLTIAAATLLVAAIATVVVIAIATGDDSEQPPGPVDGECLVVTDSDVVASPCTAERAQRIVDTLSGARICPAGTNTLIAGSMTWCLEPARG